MNFSRRKFLQFITAGFATAVAAQHVPLYVPAAQKLCKPQPVPYVPQPDGLEIIYDCQPYDADYLQVNLVWWLQDRLYARHCIKFTAFTLKAKEDLQKRIDKEVENFTKQVDLNLTHNVPHPPQLNYE